ncbi:hypothetical protein AVEN_209914-1 [Araneus ventricosus]|uniref:Uncharacterized protein n=1 Tax=Araneus ventricosus TaxID=182803 RepID=A0A4Y2K0F2_ARAVE|nr:hypothetical protein AVEN_243486-1 [Araneus ventricosus]GBM96143.1 hypothetical protein AVEN_209914-1 [Araneus ventricosus]
MALPSRVTSENQAAENRRDDEAVEEAHVSPMKTTLPSRRFSKEDDVILKTVSPLRRVVKISAERRILRRILHNDELWDTKMLRRILLAKDERIF